VTLITSQRVAATLDVPLRQHNALLVAAGFAPIWRETEFGAPELKEVRRALDYILSQQEPFPAAAVDRRWNLLQANEGAVRLVEFLVGPLAPAPRSISPTRWSRPMCCGRISPTGPMAVNPIAAALLASPLVGEPITPNLIVGLLAVFAGILAGDDGEAESLV
jgi:MmyB-like transcription regulator ligand binding domain